MKWHRHSIRDLQAGKSCYWKQRDSDCVLFSAVSEKTLLLIPVVWRCLAFLRTATI